MCKKMCSVYAEEVIIDRKVRNWFVKIRCGDTTLKGEPRVGRFFNFDN